ncbi:STAS domain-containing protein [Saccharothrix deserti]|uniref:STAS domain-containing protein n=1 Tax=Saccharothrix deserti TaxID=2593674 RepID=UPI00131C408A|nr:STAS domain-containing protein [Saccharothrix deserti]
MSTSVYSGSNGRSTTIHLAGEVDDAALPRLRDLLDELGGRQVRRLVIEMREVTDMTPGAVRALVYAQQRLPAGAEVVVVGARPSVMAALTLGGLGGTATLAG